MLGGLLDMGNTQVNCSECDHSYDPSKNVASRAAAMAACGYIGGKVAGGTGVVYAPGAGIAGAIPGAIIGGATGLALNEMFATCPDCKHTQKV